VYVVGGLDLVKAPEDDIIQGKKFRPGHSTFIIDVPIYQK
jgi:hypothetical protein